MHAEINLWTEGEGEGNSTKVHFYTVQNCLLD
jgi:hypothetical protein